VIVLVLLALAGGVEWLLDLVTSPLELGCHCVHGQTCQRLATLLIAAAVVAVVHGSFEGKEK
jgi:hypothetical protein